MKKNIVIGLLAIVSIVAFSFASQNTGAPAATESYATVAYSSAEKVIHVYYGGEEKEDIELQKGQNINNKIIDVLNGLNTKGFELVSMSTHAFNRSDVTGRIFQSSGNISTGNIDYIELFYTLKKKAG